MDHMTPSTSGLRSGTDGTVSRVFWPKTGLQRERGQAVGWRLGDVAIVVGIVDEWLTDRACAQLGLSALGSVVTCRARPEDEQCDPLVTVRGGQPVARPGASIVLFDPPDPVRLRFFKATRGSHASGVCVNGSLAKQDAYGIGGPSRSIGVERIIPLLNETKAAQRRLRLLTGQTSNRGISITSLPLSAKHAVSMLLMPIALLLHVVIWIANIGLWDHRIQDHSSTIKQLALRARQVRDAPGDFRHTLHDPRTKLDVRSRRYVRFWNTVWLILNDLVLGYCARELIVLIASQISPRLPILFQRHLVEDVVKALAWLDDWPVGLKLNTPLSRFFRSGFTMMISAWGSAISPLLNLHGQAMIRLLGLSGYGGFTLFVSMLRDAIAILSSHLRLCHAMTLTLLRWQLDSLGGLWNLFRGKKWNVLRQRTDTYAYDVDQLFLGTLLFTVSAFLFPTVLAYAALFGMIRSGLWATDKVLEMATQALNAFPLFEVLLRLKEPSRLPDGVVFTLRSDSAQSIPEIKNSPRSLSSILLRHRQAS